MTTDQRLFLNTAVRVAATRTGLDYYTDADGATHPDITAADYDTQRAYTAQLRALILATPDRFDALTVINATAATDTGALVSTGYDAGEFVDAVAANARKVNPLDPSNLPTVATWLFVGALVLGVSYIALNSSKSKLPV